MAAGERLSCMQARTLKLYIDYKSPYAYLAKELAYRLELETGVEIDWLPYILDIPAYLGSAKVDAEGRVLEQDRNAHQWRRVRYSYRDVRREANRVGLTIRGTQKIWDSSLAGIGLLHARRQGAHRAYNDEVFERFWKRELDIENPAALKDVLKRAGADVSGFDAFLEGEGRRASSRPSRKQPRPGASSACRASSSRMATCTGAASICRVSARSWQLEAVPVPDMQQGGPAIWRASARWRG